MYFTLLIAILELFFEIKKNELYLLFSEVVL